MAKKKSSCELAPADALRIALMMLARRGRLEIGACSRCWHRIERRRMARRRKGALARCAHILATNGFPDGQRELPPNAQALDRIIIEGKK